MLEWSLPSHARVLTSWMRQRIRQQICWRHLVSGCLLHLQMRDIAAQPTSGIPPVLGSYKPLTFDAQQPRTSIDTPPHSPLYVRCHAMICTDPPDDHEYKESRICQNAQRAWPRTAIAY